MLIELVKAEATLSRYICSKCSENGIEIGIDNSIDPDSILILKIDRYYNHILQNPEKSPDCLIIQKCTNNNFKIIIVELRNIKSQKGFKVNEIYEKFNTCLDDFMYQKFGNIFHSTLHNIIDIKLYFISDPYNFKQNPERQNRMEGLKLDLLMAERIPRYFGLFLSIEHHLPSPTIKAC